ncbi:Phage protein [Kerstersia similis]
MKYAGQIVTLMSQYPERGFRVVELVRHVTYGRVLSAREREAVRKAVRRVLEAMVASGSAHISKPAAVSGAYAEYSVSRYRDTESTKAVQDAGQYRQHSCVH